MKQLKFILSVSLLIIFIFFVHPSARGESEIDLSGKTITASPDTNKSTVIDGDYCNTFWTGYNNDYWQIDLGSSMTFSADTSSFTFPGSCFGLGDLVKKQYSNDGASWSNLTNSVIPSIFSCPIGPSQCTGQRYNEVTARYLRFNPSHACSGGQYFNLAALKLFGSGAPSSSPTPSPSGSSGPGPSSSDSGAPAPAITSSGEPEPPLCPNPPCFDNPDDPIETPTPDFNIKLIIPNGGERWRIGQKYKINWGYKDTENKIKKLALFLSKDGGENYQQVIEQNLPLSTEYEWTIPNDQSYVTDEAKVLVGAYGDSIDRPLLSDPSDDNFKIIGKEKFLSTDKFNFPFWIALALLLLSGSAVLWPLSLNFLLNSFITSFLNRLALLTAPTLGNKKGTGVVYDSYTKTPIARTMVRIFNIENNKQLESIITNKKGEFSFIVPNGSYYLRVNSTLYDFPSKEIKTNTRKKKFSPGLDDGTFNNIYLGEVISIKNQGSPHQKYSLNINIPLDKNKSYNLEERVLRVLRSIGNILIKIKWPSIILGTGFSILSFWSEMTILNLIILELYLVLILYEIFKLLAKNRPYGLVITQDKTPIDLALIRFNQDKKIKATSISGYDGKFTASIDPGRYNLLAKKAGFFETEQRNISIKSARKLEKLDIILKKS